MQLFGVTQIVAGCKPSEKLVAVHLRAFVVINLSKPSAVAQREASDGGVKFRTAVSSLHALFWSCSFIVSGTEGFLDW